MVTLLCFSKKGDKAWENSADLSAQPSHDGLGPRHTVEEVEGLGKVRVERTDSAEEGV